MGVGQATLAVSFEAFVAALPRPLLALPRTFIPLSAAVSAIVSDGEVASSMRVHSSEPAASFYHARVGAGSLDVALPSAKSPPHTDSS